MNLRTVFYLATLCSTLSIGTFAVADVILVNPGTDNSIAMITGVAISGTANDGLFDLTFHHGISYDTLQSNLGATSPISWTTDADADVVFAAIKVMVNSFGDVAVPYTDDVLIPLAESGSLVNAKTGVNFDAASYSSWFQSTPASALSNQSSSLQANDAWITASAAVPEPSGFLCLSIVGLGRLVLGSRQGRQHQPK